MEYKYEPQPRTRMSNISRYADLRILTNPDKRDKFLETYRSKPIPRSVDDFYHTVKPEEEFRLELISFRFYQTPLLWWVIAQANDIKNPLLNPKVGDVLRVPSIVSLYGTNGLLL